VRVNKVLKKVLGLGREVVIVGRELVEADDEIVRPRLEVTVRLRAGRRGRCGRCGTKAAWYDQGDGRRRWRHIDIGYVTCELVAEMPRVACPVHGPTAMSVPWARHDGAFTAAFEDLVVHDAVVANKQRAADRYGISWRAVNNACVRLAEEALGRVDLLEGLVAVAIDEVKYKKGQRYLTVVCDHVTGKVVWAAKGRSKPQCTGRLRDGAWVSGLMP
jgi:transposase